ncbi:MAG TPA: hypothetical protein VIF37_16250 [Methylobacter sp.]|jgi:hypothetical protein
MSYVLIDPPVGHYSAPDEIQAWIDKLISMPQSDQRDSALEYAKQLLAEALADPL